MAESCCRCWVPTTTSPGWPSTATSYVRRSGLPIAPGTGRRRGRVGGHDRQHYRLVGWRNGVCGYRRFFSITSLAGLRQEDPAVFERTHAEVARWFAEGLVDGVRIDHPDGLTDPAGYLQMLRRLLGLQAWIVIEKIPAVGEPLTSACRSAVRPATTCCARSAGVFIDPAGADALTAMVDRRA